jgi:hypothetical protein
MKTMTVQNRPGRYAGATKRHLSPARRQLLTLLQRVNFGRVEHLEVRGGEPVLDPMPRVVREFKFGGENTPRPETRLADLPLKDQHVDLLELLDEIGDGVIPLLTCKHGTPFSCETPG